MESKQRLSRNIKNLYLDPNNYRFIDNDNYIPISNEKITDSNIQKRARLFIEGKKRKGVKDLLKSFKANGFLNVDVIQLKDLGDNKFLVLEGNRRVTALKILQEEYQSGLDIGKLNPEIFKKVPSEIYQDQDESEHLIIMGLKHISGNKKWPAINQAKLIHDYLEPCWSNEQYYSEESNLCQSLGITMAKLRSSQRAYRLILQYKASDYGDQFESDMYYTFAEITKKPAIKKWIEWNDSSYQARNDENILRLFSWLSEKEEIEDLDEEEIDENRKYPPIITKYREVQDLAKFISNEDALEAMESSGSVARGLLVSGSIEQESYAKNFDKLKSSISELDRLKGLLQPNDIEELRKLNKKFDSILPSRSELDVQTDNVLVCFEKGKINHFSSIAIGRYKLLENFKLDKLNRINIFAGFNNTGKTTLLEAIYLLTKQNNISAFFELTRLKNKLDKLNTEYLNSYFNQNLSISGSFNNIETNVEIEKFQATDIDQKDDYISSYKIKSTIDGTTLKTKTHTFKHNPIQRFSDNVEILCHSVLKSPYFYNKSEVISTHSKNVESKVYQKIVNFITTHIDNNINGIEFTEDDSVKRFLVDSQLFPDRSVDLTSYGEGLQRIFEISLAFAYCKNGVLLVDELETAIHKSLLTDFTKFIQELAIEFNVQVFITSHSKECIDAFVTNEFNNDEISTYFLKANGNLVDATYISGDKLIRFINSIDFDLRGS
jgi:AAA15 family ATPase/GTPase